VGLQPQLNPDLPYRPASFTPVCQTFELVFALAVSPESPHRIAADLASAARARRGASPDDGTAAALGHTVHRPDQLEGQKFSMAAPLFPISWTSRQQM
jgi:tripartite-type tricarboxylate transporter receptor subunit TctC